MSSLVCVGASLGGVDAISCVLAELPKQLQAPVLIVLHRADSSGTVLLRLLQQASTLAVAEAQDKSVLNVGEVLLAPSGYHLLVDEVGQVHLSTEAPVNLSRPSVDVLLESAAVSRGAAVIAVILTGSGCDGAAGAAAVARRGGLVAVEDPASAFEPSMPKSTLELVPEASVVPKSRMGAWIARQVARQEGRR